MLALSCIVVFVTTYALILPAFTLDKEKAASQGGIDLPVSEVSTEVVQEDLDAYESEQSYEVTDEDIESSELDAISDTEENESADGIESADNNDESPYSEETDTHR